MNTFNENIQVMSEKFGNALACQYIEDGQIVKVNYKQFMKDINKISRYLLFCGMQKKNIGLLGRNSYHWLVCYLAIVNINGVAVLLNPEVSIEELRELMQKADVEKLFCGIEWKEAFADCVLLEIEQSLDKTSDFSGEQLICEGSMEALATICFTSGTTGKQKGVMLSQKGLLSFNVMKDHADIEKITEKYMSAIPIYHIAGLTNSIQILTGTVLCITKSAKYFYRDLRMFSPHYLNVVPMMLDVVCKELHKKHFDRDVLGGSLRTIYCGGAKMNDKAVMVLEKAGIQIIQAYGMTEMSGGIALNTPDSGKPDSAGKILPWVQVKIVDGEILVKSEYMMLGYYNEAEETDKIMKDGWLHTGDLGYLDEEGFLYLTGRKKNLIILNNGENVSPEELEIKLKNCILIQEVQVYERDAKICAEIYAEQDESIREQIREFISKWNMTEPLYKQIRTIVFRDLEFEKTENGKIKRNN